MKQRKTISIKRIKELINHTILNSVDADINGREYLQKFIESVLMETRNYSGFGYLTPGDMDDSLEGTTVGINFDAGSCPRALDAAKDNRFTDTDHTRVIYF